jgi:hypothetical protein
MRMQLVRLCQHLTIRENIVTSVQYFNSATNLSCNSSFLLISSGTTMHAVPVPE